MGQPQITLDGTPAQLAEQLLSLPGTQKYRMTLMPAEPREEEVESLDAAITRMICRTPEEVGSIRERILSSAPPPRELPEGKTLFDMVMGNWPGEETDKQVLAALEKLS